LTGVISQPCQNSHELGHATPTEWLHLWLPNRAKQVQDCSRRMVQ